MCCATTTDVPSSPTFWCGGGARVNFFYRFIAATPTHKHTSYDVILGCRDSETFINMKPIYTRGTFNRGRALSFLSRENFVTYAQIEVECASLNSRARLSEGPFHSYDANGYQYQHQYHAYKNLSRHTWLPDDVETQRWWNRQFSIVPHLRE